ncbi:TRAP-type C4-dicarboxylate transport system, small permease component [Nitrincola lacisaponensis]|uniref:TRAP transporter small permease protein n=1 Tax=Nitrincola lacisaponensis TaxID=267850 RepID=A0A063Y7Q7_9GAMM|nr:TRAP transporter small permease [Nitrincola lacisaponensis]KDE41160.1 TRAP-type C4-dicarboxylate transport system, small permease component [Nitrincola lacisaponensis]
MIRLLHRIEQGVGLILKPTIVLGMLALITVITLQIVSRVFFNAVPWTEEVARFLLIWITFLGGALAFQQGRHIAVNFAVDALPASLRHWAKGLACLILLAFMAKLAMIGYEYMQVQSFQRSPSLRWSMSYVYAVMPISAALIFFYALVDLLELIFKSTPCQPEESSL